MDTRFLSLKAGLAFLCVFVIGVAVGGMIVFNLSDQRFSKFLSRANDPASMAIRINQKIAEEYHLDQKQQDLISPLTREMAENLHRIRQQFGSDVIKNMDTYHRKVAELMSAEQRSAYEEANIERRRRAVSALLPDTQQK